MSFYGLKIHAPLPSAAAFETREFREEDIEVIDGRKYAVYGPRDGVNADRLGERHRQACEKWAQIHYRGAVMFGGWLCGDFGKTRMAWVIAWWTEEIREAWMSKTTPASPS